jgi:hypothetical protein
MFLRCLQLFEKSEKTTKYAPKRYLEPCVLPTEGYRKETNRNGNKTGLKHG